VLLDAAGLATRVTVAFARITRILPGFGGAAARRRRRCGILILSVRVRTFLDRFPAVVDQVQDNGGHR